MIGGVLHVESLNYTSMKKFALSVLSIITAVAAYGLNPLVADLESTFLKGEFTTVSGTVTELEKMYNNQADGDKSLVSDMDLAVAYAYDNFARSALEYELPATEMSRRFDYVSQMLGQDHYMTVMMSTFINRHSQDLKAVDRAMELVRDERGASSWEYASMVPVKAEKLMYAGKNKDAIALETETIALHDNAGRSDSWMKANSLAFRGALKAVQRDTEGAYADIDKAVDIVNGFKGNEYCGGIQVFGNAVFVYTQTGYFDGAIQAGQGVDDIFKRIGIADSFVAAKNKHNYASAYALKKDYAKSLSLYNEVKSAYEALGKTDTEEYKRLVRSIDWVKSQK